MKIISPNIHCIFDSYSRNKYARNIHICNRKTRRRNPCRLSTTKTQLEAKNFTGLTGEQISGDLLTATIWSWFAAAESHNRLSQNQANMIENQGLSYGLFHAIAQPVYSWGVIRKVTFPGVNMDIGHVRPIGYSKDNDKNTWIAYNKLRGQYMSALEHAIPERFFNDPAKCNPDGTTTPVAGLPACPQGISAVKAIGLAASQGQKIYTITPEVYQNNPNIVSTALSAHSQNTKQAIQNELDAGREVTIHERPITQSGWTGSGYIYTDPETGAGGYIIEGGTNGGSLKFVGDNSDALGFAFFVLGLFATLATSPVIPLLVAISALVVGIMALMAAHLDALESAQCPSAAICINQIFGLIFSIGLALAIIGLFASPVAGLALGLVGLIFGDNFAKSASNGCNGSACHR